MKSITADAEIEKYLGEPFRVMAHARFYKQSGALFWSDDYTGGDRPLGPKGRYWTGDRELSPFDSLMLGLRATYTITKENGRVLGVMQSVKLSLSGDVMHFGYDEYTLGGASVGGGFPAWILALALSAAF